MSAPDYHPCGVCASYRDVCVYCQPDFVQTLRSGAEPTDNPVTLHPLIAEDLDSQTCEMERARAQAAVSCHDYLLDGEQ